ncbi:hypothetical protein PYCCODRAFT_1375128 [Trametes coccinea BRFM310]|uniref:Mediator of RNA polymerase II transcription subunit 19 n=1 Tax=Trametes coccinea (strain BRFM310) TaxID=1353009 RepID=A0A1Y2IDH6_TRAC3|nr:hypothetical protein PYCCODRAFT_1375128 [Trametes coccinea BRFM310]
MDIDEQLRPHRPSLHSNAVAGPSTLPDVPPLYLPPSGRYVRHAESLSTLADSLPSPGPSHRRTYFTSTQDLLSRFQLLPSYDRYVRPFAPPVGSIPQATASSATDRGKGKEKEIPSRDVAASSPAAHTPGAGQDGDDDEGGRGEKKYKNYRHLIKGLPGKHSMKKDDYLTTLMQIPPKQKAAITPFDLRTQREAFSVSLEGLKGWNIHALVAESSQAREDRKRRLKKLAKAQAQGVPQPTVVGGMPNTPSAYPATPAGVSVTTPGGPNHPTLPHRTSTPRPLPNVSKQPPLVQQPSTQPQGRTPVGIGTPHSVFSPDSNAIRPPATSLPAQYGAAAQTSPSNPDQASMQFMRGIKRERERDYSADGGLQVNGNIPPTNQHQDTSRQPGKGAKAGNAGVRPRPLKKQRLDTGAHGHVPIQQPTPHA